MIDTRRVVVPVTDHIEHVTLESYHTGSCTCYKNCDCSSHKGELLSSTAGYGIIGSNSLFVSFNYAVRTYVKRMLHIRLTEKRIIDSKLYFESIPTQKAGEIVAKYRHGRKNIKGNYKDILALDHLRVEIYLNLQKLILNTK